MRHFLSLILYRAMAPSQEMQPQRNHTLQSTHKYQQNNGCWEGE